MFLGSAFRYLGPSPYGALALHQSSLFKVKKYTFEMPVERGTDPWTIKCCPSLEMTMYRPRHWQARRLALLGEIWYIFQASKCKQIHPATRKTRNLNNSLKDVFCWAMSSLSFWASKRTWTIVITGQYLIVSFLKD